MDASIVMSKQSQSGAGIGWRHLDRRPIGGTSADSLDALIGS